MGFIERIAGAMKPTPAQEASETTDQENISQEPEQEPDMDDIESEDASNDVADPEQKTYSEKEIAEVIEQQKKIWETDRMNSLTKDGQIEALKAELLRKELQEKVNFRLDEVKLPLGISKLVQYTDEAGTMENLETVITTVNQLVADGIKLRLRGKTPEGLGAANNRNILEDPFIKCFLKDMGKKEE